VGADPDVADVGEIRGHSVIHWSKRVVRHGPCRGGMHIRTVFGALLSNVFRWASPDS
jgi:hypothetical protein